jgi:hypothetical protein
MDMDKIEINGRMYVPEETFNMMAPRLDGMRYCMVRTFSAGVFAGYLQKRDGKEVTLRKARRIWRWEGAASLSQLAVDGTSKPEGCMFPCEVDEILLTEAVEIIPMTDKAKKSIAEVPVWKA